MLDVNIEVLAEKTLNGIDLFLFPKHIEVTSLTDTLRGFAKFGAIAILIRGRNRCQLFHALGNFTRLQDISRLD